MSSIPRLRKLNTIVFELPVAVVKPGYSARSFTLESLNLSDTGLDNLITMIMETVYSESDYQFSMKISGATGATIKEIIEKDSTNLTITSLIHRLRFKYEEQSKTSGVHHVIHIDEDDMRELTRKIIVQSVIVYAMTHRENIHTIYTWPHLVCAFDSYQPVGAAENHYISTWEILQACNIMQPLK